MAASNEIFMDAAVVADFPELGQEEIKKNKKKLSLLLLLFTGFGKILGNH